MLIKPDILTCYRQGACRQLRKALRKMAAYLPECEGVDTGTLYRQAGEVLARIEGGETVSEFPAILRS